MLSIHLLILLMMAGTAGLPLEAGVFKGGTVTSVKKVSCPVLGLSS